MKILVETSARHIHLSEQDFIKLFGKNKILNKKKDLSQPGQFACFEKVDIFTSGSSLKNVTVLGPFRNETQVEISLTDARTLKVNDIFIRESGFLKNTHGCKLVGPVGCIEIPRGLIVAKRHVHLTPEISEKNNLKNSQIVSVKIFSQERSLIFDDVIIRVDKNYFPAMHIDTDEANAAGIQNFSHGKILL